VEWKKDKRFNAFATLKETYCIGTSYGGYLVTNIEGFEAPMKVKISYALLSRLSMGQVAGEFRMIGNKLGGNGRPKQSPLFLAYEGQEAYI